MFASLASFISRYSKVIIAVWVVVMLVIVPVAADSFSSSNLSLIGNEGGESQEGLDILHNHFHNSGIEDNPVLVLAYDNPSGSVQFWGNEETGNIVEYLINGFRYDMEWVDKLQTSNGIYVLDESFTEDNSHGVVALGFVYKSTYTAEQMIDDTPRLRSAVNEKISEYLSEIGVGVKHFDSYVTGNTAVLYDTGTSTAEMLIVALIVVLLIAVVLMGLFFGSVMTSVISAVSIVFSALLTMAFLYILSISIVVHTIIWVMVMFLCVLLSFACCVFFISAYKRQLIDGADKDHALENTVLKTSRIYLVIGICLILASIVFSLYPGSTIRVFGFGLLASVVSVMLVSFFVPASLICITKNELFWTRSVDGTFKAISFEKYYLLFERFSIKITTSIDRFLDRRYIPVIIIISIVTVASAACVVTSNVNSEKYDLTDSMMVDDSAKGIDILKSHSMGGLFQPYTVVIESKSDIGKIERVVDSPYSYHYEIQWTGDIYGLNSELRSLQSSLLSCDSDNIYKTVSIEIWDCLVKDAKIEGITSPDMIIDHIGKYLSFNNIIAYQGCKDALDTLKLEKTDEWIVEFGGPIIDYSMNSWLSDVGFEKVSTGDIVVDYIAVSVFTKDTCTSDKSIATSDAIDGCVEKSVLKSKYFAKYWLCGTGMTYKNLYNEINTGYVPLIAIIFLIIFVFLYMVEKEISVPLSIAATSTVSILISSAIIMSIVNLVIGSISHTILLMIPIFTITFSLWFGYMQIGMMRGCGTISEMKREFNPVIIVTSLVIAFGSILMMFSEIDYISQMGFAVVVMILVDAFVVRLVLAPALWKYCTIHKVKYFEKYSQE